DARREDGLVQGLPFPGEARHTPENLEGGQHQKETRPEAALQGIDRPLLQLRVLRTIGTIGIPFDTEGGVLQGAGLNRAAFGSRPLADEPELFEEALAMILPDLLRSALHLRVILLLAHPV